MTNASLSAAVDQTHEKIAALRVEGRSLQTKLTSVAQPLEALQRLHAAENKELEALTKDLEALTKKRDEAKQKKTETEKRLADAKKNQLDKEVEYYVYSPPLQVQVLSSPIALRAAKAKVKRGETMNVPLSLQRQFKFNGPVQLTANFPGGAGLSAAPTAVGRGQSLARLSVQASENARVGKQQVKLQARLKFNNVDIQDQIVFDVEVVEADESQSK